ncbi:hypothetical protein CCR95_17170 [Thiocystis minor]|nr:hypothetical protein [Thiocystis minor]
MAKAGIAFDIDPPKKTSLLDADSRQGHTTQCHGVTWSDEREIVLGLDFGTSSVKVVIGDSALGVAFAVPFSAGIGIERYLLPCRLYASKKIYSMRKGRRDYRDLKLSLVAEPTNPTLQEPVIAFLAFVIRHARDWLFREHLDKYRNTRIRWRLKIGLPVAHHFDRELSRVFMKIGQTAWLVANAQGEITSALVDSASLRGEELTRSAPGPLIEDEDIEVEVLPEIAAQIYGFVNSNRFDPQARNIYLMVDVGAGSVDSSLFHVKPARGGRWDFEFFTSVVEPYGVMNLHRHRIHWWRKALQRNASGEDLLSSLDRLKFQTDQETGIPDCYARYFEGVRVDFADHRQTPDALFFGQVREQVQRNTYWQTWKKGLLGQQDLGGISAFYCGGGTRMPFYRRLCDYLRSDPNCTWLSAIPRRIELPEKLKAPGLRREDFDRLTVAYGLSFLEVGKIVESIPQPKLIMPSSGDWRDNYLHK